MGPLFKGFFASGVQTTRGDGARREARDTGQMIQSGEAVGESREGGGGLVRGEGEGRTLQEEGDPNKGHQAQTFPT